MYDKENKETNELKSHYLQISEVEIKKYIIRIIQREMIKTSVLSLMYIV